MRKLLIAAAVLAAIPWSAGAQVEKQVEVTKAYVPSLESASKLGITPDMTDTTRMRPEIDYTITPLSLRTTLQTRPIRPATVTYWEFNRPLPFYLKVGAGYPLNSVVDFYASSQNPGTGYVVGYLNHEGRYAKIGNDFGVKNNSLRMTNLVGAAAGKYLGRRVLEGDLSFENRMYHRYGTYIRDGGVRDVPFTPGAMADYSDANLALRFGDDFQDLSRTNFEVALRGGLFFDHSDRIEFSPESSAKYNQTSLGGRAKVARSFGRHRFSVDAGYERMWSRREPYDYLQQQIRAGVRYGLDGGAVRLEAGADYYLDMIRGTATGNYLIPRLRLDFNLGTPGLRPFIEIDGGVYENSFRTLSRQNPYLTTPVLLEKRLKSSVDYNGRIGLDGSLWRSRFTYRLYAAFSIHDNHLYWTTDRILFTESASGTSSESVTGLFTPVTARQTVTSFNGEIEWRPISVLGVDLGVHGFLYNDDTTLHSGEPAFQGNLGIRYEDRKIAFGVSALVESERKWSVNYQEYVDAQTTPSLQRLESVAAAGNVDLRVDFEWKVSGRVGIFAEGRNLLNCRLYQFPFYPEYGASFTAGVKLNF